MIIKKEFICCVLSLIVFYSCQSSKINRDISGAYRLETGEFVSIRKSVKNTFRYRVYETGATGRLYQENENTLVSGAGFANKSPEYLRIKLPDNPYNYPDTLEWIEKDSPRQFARKINREEWISFNNKGVRLNARVNLPDGDGPFPAVVLVHGSGDNAATEFYYNGDFFAANGIATLTYDKRGTGRSSGVYTFDYQLLASDVISAVKYMQQRKDIIHDQIGLSAYSQGCWVAPLAASKFADIKFVIANYGLIESATEEAIIETRNTMLKRGLKQEDIHELDALTEAAVNVVASGFNEGWERVDKLDKRFKDRYWRKFLKGTTVNQFLKFPKWLIKIIGPKKAPKDLDWTYNSDHLLQNMNIPIVWLLAEKDKEAPNELTIPKVNELIQNGKPYELHVFKGADHTMLLFDEDNEERIYTKYAKGYFQKEVNSARKLCSNLNPSSPEEQ